MSVQEKRWGKLVVDEATGKTQAIIRCRREYVIDEDFSLDPGSLVGSWFQVLVGGDMVWQGVVVGEPQAGRYLCDIDRLEPGAFRVQRVFSLDTLMGLGDEARRLLEGSMGEAKAPVIDPTVEWRLYDSREEAAEAYRAWAVTRGAAEIADELK